MQQINEIDTAKFDKVKKFFETVAEHYAFLESDSAKPLQLWENSRYSKNALPLSNLWGWLFEFSKIVCKLNILYT